MRSVTKVYGTTEVVRRVDFDVQASEVHALAGSNGAGKSTLMKIAQGVVRPSDGSVWVGGHPLMFSDPDESRRAGLAMVFQELSLAPTLSVIDNIFLNAEPTRQRVLIDGDQERREARELFERLDVKIDLDAEVSRLGVGEQQMVEIAKALRLTRVALLLDEPTAALSEREIRRLFDIIRQIASLGVGIVFITHHLREIFQIADRVTVLRDGQVAMTSAISDTELPAVVRSMVGTDLHAARPTAGYVSAPAEAAALAVRDLGVGDKLHGISFDAYRGEIIGIAGLAGSGRTTLLKALFGAIPHTGTVSLNGAEVRATSPAEAIRAGIYLIPENRHQEGVVLIHSVADNLLMSLLSRLRRGPLYDSARARRVARELVAEMSIQAESIDQIVESLSGGNQQKVVVGKALASDSSLLLLDEPTFGIDVRTGAELHIRARDFVNQGNAALWVSSDLREVIEVCDRILVIADGELKEVVSNKPDRVSEERLVHAIQRSGNGHRSAA
jgi:ribose transport system ATP-binding protein